ncbi:MAG TPA: erythromycin esterase family protein [Acidimicrobiales bacterium]|nr:erythromycin esterase family protein [Acidimicrobiales bacterium]
MARSALAADVDAVRAAAVPITGASDDYDELLRRIGDRRVVLLGEASHGTHEFYRERARITQRLIEEKGFNAVAVEADWPDAYRVNRYVTHRSDDTSATESLADFERFPAWMWRNADVVRFVEWLRARNAAHGDMRSRARFYGLDLYSLRASMEAVVRYLDGVDPAAAARARERYSCFDHVSGEGPEYGHAVSLNLTVPCEQQVISQLVDLRRQAHAILSRDGWLAEDEFFFAEQNAHLVHHAEEYYREMYRGRVSSWNLRDRHMADTLAALVDHLHGQLGAARVVVWEHNSHVGDARHTEMGQWGEWNVGQLARTQWPGECFNVGFTTDHGTVTAASDWGGVAERKRVRPALPDSHEALLHACGLPAFLVPTERVADVLGARRLERAIGVIYRPETERASHWFHASMSQQFDAVIHVDRTTAVEPLERSARWDEGEAPETFPTGL